MKKQRMVAALLVAVILTASVSVIGVNASDEKALAPQNEQSTVIENTETAEKGESTKEAIEETETAENSSKTMESESSKARAIPHGSYPINLNVNGRDVLRGKVFNLGGITYVPMFAFADWLGNFTYSYNDKTATAKVEGENLEIIAHEGDLYIIANGRYFYTGREVIEFGGEIFVPILPMTKALNSRVQWRDDINGFYVSSGDTRRLKNASQVYRDDEVLWLARIISAESRGEPMKGKLAVGNVVLNRVRSPLFPNTIYGVIFDRKYGVQFSPVENGTIYNTPTADSIIAAKMCLEGYSLSSDILYFVNPTKAPNSWIANNRTYAFTIANHAFFD